MQTQLRIQTISGHFGKGCAIESLNPCLQEISPDFLVPYPRLVLKNALLSWTIYSAVKFNPIVDKTVKPTRPFYEWHTLQN